MVGWHHWLNGHEFEQAPGDGEGLGSLVCFSPWGHKELDTTEQLNNKCLFIRLCEHLSYFHLELLWAKCITFVLRPLYRQVFLFSWINIWEWNFLGLWWLYFHLDKKLTDCSVKCYIIFHFHQQYVRFTVAPHPHQLLILTVSLILAIPGSV